MERGTYASQAQRWLDARASTPTARWYPAENHCSWFLKLWRCAGNFPDWIGNEICLEAGKPAIDSLGKADLPSLLGRDSLLKNKPDLLLHGPTMEGGSHTQALFDRFIEVSNGDTGHGLTPIDCNDIIVIRSPFGPFYDE
jgi:hypothetical protein